MKHHETKGRLDYHEAEVGERVRFHTHGDHKYLEVKLQKDGSLLISSPDGSIIMRPNVSNVIQVELDPH